MCQKVDGCGRDLSSEKAYLQRYSVCDAHFKAEVSLVNSQEVRFCQQCNKFQDLREFEGVRRWVGTDQKLTYWLAWEIYSEGPSGLFTLARRA